MKSCSLSSFHQSGACVCALGCFDGVHIGHVALISEAIRISQELSLPSLVWSFKEPPKSFFSGESVPLLTTLDEKRDAMRTLGVDIFMSVLFDKSIASLSAEDFFENILIKKINAAYIVCGFNYRFGCGGTGDTALLAKLCKKHNIGLSVIPHVTIGNKNVSSSEIRTALINGRISEANVLLGRPYSLRSKVINGRQLGRTLGFPTVNQKFERGKLILKNGVYVSRISFGRTKRFGITNVGYRPTVDGVTLCAETNLFDFNGDLYGKTLTIEFLEFLRSERKFDSIDELSEQVHTDIARAKDIINEKYK